MIATHSQRGAHGGRTTVPNQIVWMTYGVPGVLSGLVGEVLPRSNRWRGVLPLVAAMIPILAVGTEAWFAVRGELWERLAFYLFLLCGLYGANGLATDLVRLLRDGAKGHRDEGASGGPG